MEENVSAISRVLFRIREAAEEALRERHPAHPTPQPEASGPFQDQPPPTPRRQSFSHAIWLSAEEAVAYLRLKSRKALYQAVRRGHFPVHRVGRGLRFLRAELDAALKRG